ncbi:MAG: URC4/urg3 family protein [Chroococcidiopsidaceae cyanobacterium CP_BM_RX_35]|nr:URC4/urg3 family protein [Chroococcidiopsidaceae cyanobacterium CP_BM_RX_35]
MVGFLRSPVAIRECCGRLFDLACADRLRYFGCDLSRLGEVAGYVVGVMRDQYPDLQVPFHSRWRHFEAGGVLRLNRLAGLLADLTLVERARAKFDLVVVSVLLDAGAGELWQYSEPGTAQVFRRSEGLAVASFWMFCQGGFSGDRGLRVDAYGLQGLTEEVLASGFQVNLENPLVGLAGRLELLQRLGRSLLASPQLFGSENPRPGHLVDYLLQQSSHGQLAAEKVLSVVLEGLGDIWPGRLEIAGVNLGDVWYHSALTPRDGESLMSGSLVPFHKLSQWLTYSLLEPLQELGLEITGLDALTGLPEYRNGGLCLDLGLLQVKHSDVLQHRHSIGSEVIVEWRALTVILLDRIAAAVREQLGMSAEKLPLVKVLQGGTWSAGRRIAAQLRAGGVPPIQIESDGTVF